MRLRWLLFPCLLFLPVCPIVHTHICFIPPSKASFVLFTTSFHIPFFFFFFFFFSTISFTFFLAVPCSSRPVAVLLDVYLARAFLLTLIACFTSSLHHATALLHTINFVPVTLLAVVLADFLHISTTDAYLAFAFLLARIAPFTSSSHHFTDLLHTTRYQLRPYYFTCCGLDQLIAPILLLS